VGSQALIDRNDNYTPGAAVNQLDDGIGDTLVLAAWNK
jgi:hypothetical protein